MTWFWIIEGAWLSVALAWGYIDRDRRHQNCRWWSRWRKRPCYACIRDMERECGIGVMDLSLLRDISDRYEQSPANRRRP